MATSDRLTDERVREWAEQEMLGTVEWRDATALAREVLALRQEVSRNRGWDKATTVVLDAKDAEIVALREELGEANAVLAEGNDGFVQQVQQFAEWKAKDDALIADLTAQRDEAVARLAAKTQEYADCHEALAACQAQASGEIRKLTQERDEAVAIAREADKELIDDIYRGHRDNYDAHANGCEVVGEECAWCAEVDAWRARLAAVRNLEEK